MCRDGLRVKAKASRESQYDARGEIHARAGTALRTCTSGRIISSGKICGSCPARFRPSKHHMSQSSAGSANLVIPPGALLPLALVIGGGPDPNPAMIRGNEAASDRRAWTASQLRGLTPPERSHPSDGSRASKCTCRMKAPIEMVAIRAEAEPASPVVSAKTRRSKAN